MNSEECLVVRCVSWIDEETPTLMKGRSKQTAIKVWHYPKPSSPTKRSNSRILRSYCGAREFVTPAHFMLRPKTYAEEIQGRVRIIRVMDDLKKMAEDEFLLGMP